MQVGVGISVYPIPPSRRSSRLPTSLGQMPMRLFLPFVQYVEDAMGGPVIATTIPFPSFYRFYITFFNNTGQVGTQVEVASRLLRFLVVWQTDPAKAAEIILLIDGGAGMK